MSLLVGLMSGTSADAIDAVLMDFEREPPCTLATRSHPIPAGVRERILESQTGDSLEAVLELDVAMGHLFAEAALALLADAGVDSPRVRAIGCHGQTVRHRPSRRPAYTLQVGDPNIIVERTGITTVADFRRRDLAAGGVGAPLVPGYHEALFRTAEHTRVVVNIGGIANVTILPSDPRAAVTGFDTGPGNGLLDAWSAKHLGRAMDEGGEWAGGGEVDFALLERLLGDPYFSQSPPKSTGKEYFNLPWVDRMVAGSFPPPSPRDTQRTLVELTVRSIADAIDRHRPPVDEVLVCGGGVRNPVLMSSLSARLARVRVSSTSRHGVDPAFVEAGAFAWLAERTLAGLPGNVPSVTGARHPVVLGAIYRGSSRAS